MHSSYVWHQLNLYSNKIILVTLLTLSGVLSTNLSKAQDLSTLNLPFFDSQTIHYGFLIGTSVSRFQMNYHDDYISPDLDTLHSIVPTGNVGFKVGFIVDYHIHDVFDIRGGLTASFTQLKLDYRFTDGLIEEQLLDPTFVELPILMKYKSIRRGNRRMYILAGVNPTFRVSGTKEQEDETERLLINNFNLAIEFGAGFDLYQSLFKFSPEIRYSWGLFDMLDRSEPNRFTTPLERLAVHTLTFYITFEGGPSELKVGGKKKRRRRH